MRKFSTFFTVLLTLSLVFAFAGDVNGSKSAATDANGVATLSIKIKATVTDFTYDSAANVETCDTY